MTDTVIDDELRDAITLKLFEYGHRVSKISRGKTITGSPEIDDIMELVDAYVTERCRKARRDEARRAAKIMRNISDVVLMHSRQLERQAELRRDGGEK